MSKQGQGVVTMKTFDPSSYPPLLADLLRDVRLATLGPGSPNRVVQSRLEKLTLETAFASEQVCDPVMAQACFAGLWLCHDFLDQSHAISQEIATPTGSYWHGILHRREPDASNAAYWFRRVGEHPIFETLAREAQNLGLRVNSDPWNPFGFIDLCEEHRGTGTEQEMLLRHVQRLEWELLFDWCFRRATGKD
jgi:hypothetical protein